MSKSIESTNAKTLFNVEKALRCLTSGLAGDRRIGGCDIRVHGMRTSPIELLRNFYRGRLSELGRAKPSSVT